VSLIASIRSAKTTALAALAVLGLPAGADTSSDARSPQAQADGEHAGTSRKREVFFFRYGVISDEGKLSAFPGPKLFAVGTRRDFTGGPLLSLLSWQLELGGIFDGRRGASSGAFATVSAGLETKSEPFFFYYLPGVALISSPDDYLSTVYQFSHDLGAGIRDSRGVTIDMSYRHFSNAGIALPNPGRNYLVLRLAVPLDAVW
jgi:hypothetical protein